MSKLDELIAELCQDGVEYKPLWSVTIWDKKFNSVDRKKQPQVISYNYLLAADLFALQQENGNVFLLSTGEQTGWTTEEFAGNNIHEGEVITIPWGKSRAVTDCIKYYKGKFVTADNRIMTSNDTTVLHNKYLYYVIMSMGKLIDTFYRGSGIKHPDMAKVLDLKIPVPPLPVQSEIVRILDNFTELTAELTKELTAELTARKKQYEYYKEKLFSLDVEYHRLGDFILRNIGGGTPSKQKKEYWNGTIPWVSVKDIVKESVYLNKTTDYITENGLNNSSSNIIEKGNIIVATRINPGKMLIANDNFAINQDLRGLELKDTLMERYLVYYFQTLSIKGKGTTVKGISVQELENIKIPVPLLEIQKRVVDILDRFDTLCNDISTELPAEIEARQKQYEYYRDKLLTFKELS